MRSVGRDMVMFVSDSDSVLDFRIEEFVERGEEGEGGEGGW